MKSEPSASIGVTVSAILYAVWLVLRAAGVEVTEDLRNGVELLILALCGIPAVAGLITRLFVVSPETAANVAVMAKQDAGGSREVPAVGGPAGSAYADAVKQMGFIPAPPPAG